MRRKPQRFGEIFSDPIRQQTYVSETTLKKKPQKQKWPQFLNWQKLLKYELPSKTANRDVQNCKSLRKRLLEPDGDVAKKAKHTDSIMGWQVCGAIGMLAS